MVLPQDFQNFIKTFKERNDPMTSIFVGHGNPMNAIEQNSFTQGWMNMVSRLYTPSAIVVISAHWLTKGTFVTAMEHPPTIHDFGGFPTQLYDVYYPAIGSPVLCDFIQHEVKYTDIALDYDWGLDHGTWSVLKHMYPGANIPVIQLSIDYTKSFQYHYELAQEVSTLRKRGVLIIASGNIVHNLRKMDLFNPNRTAH